MRAWGVLLLISISFITAGSAEISSDSLKNLTEVGVFTTSNPHSAQFFKDYLFIADGSSLLVYNTTSPEQPKLVTMFTDFAGGDQILGLSISEDQLYVAAGPGWVYVFDISDPENPKKITTSVIRTLPMMWL